MSAGTVSFRQGRFPSMVQWTQGMHKGAWDTPLESAGTTEWTPASGERVTKTRVAQQGGRDEAARACSGGRRARFRWLDVITLVTRAFTRKEGEPLFRPVCVAFGHTGHRRHAHRHRDGHPPPSGPHATPPVSPRILGRQDADRGSRPAPDVIAPGGSCWPAPVGAGPGHARAHGPRRPQLHVIMVKNLLIKSLVWIRLGIFSGYTLHRTLSCLKSLPSIYLSPFLSSR